MFKLDVRKFYSSNKVVRW